VHHRIPQMYSGHPEFADFDFHSPDNLIGVPGNRVGTGPANVHNGITQDWNEFARTNPNASRAEIEAHAIRIDAAYQGFYWHW
jgi:hypothetical protein